MHIPDKLASGIRAIDVDAPITIFSLPHWLDSQHLSDELKQRVLKLHRLLGDRFTRRDMVRLYQSEKLDALDKFLASMIWGHESGEGGQRDGRGPWKVRQMISDETNARQGLASVDVSSHSAIAASYSALTGAFNRCGPNFFTKHMYFVGKALALSHYPVIFDNRVARGICQVAGLKGQAARMISVSTSRSLAGYMTYLDFVHRESDRLGCQPDQIELFLFGAAGLD